MARQCIASIGTDRDLPRRPAGSPAAGRPERGGEEEVAFFNFGNPDAMRTNTRQSAIDVVQEARLFTETKMTVPASVAVTGATITFDATKRPLHGALAGGLERAALLRGRFVSAGGVLSGSSSSVPITLLEKTSPAAEHRRPLALRARALAPFGRRELNIFHPIMSFAQTVVDPIDPLVYMAYLVQRPRRGTPRRAFTRPRG